MYVVHLCAFIYMLQILTKRKAKHFIIVYKIVVGRVHACTK